MKLKKEYISYPLEGNTILVGTGNAEFKGMAKANPTAAFVLNCLSKDISEEELISRMLEKYDADRDVIEKDVTAILNKLRTIGALEE